MLTITTHGPSCHRCQAAAENARCHGEATGSRLASFNEAGHRATWASTNDLPLEARYDDDTLAAAEGWWISNDDEGNLEIQRLDVRDDGLESFANDDAAVAYVERFADLGSARHQRALDHVARNNSPQAVGS